MYEFRWNQWNIDHIGEHGVSPEEAEEVTQGARAPYPHHIGDRKFIVRGRTITGSLLQVIFIVDLEKTLNIIHARPLTPHEKRTYRRRIR